jgi:hypothetical protein
VDGLLRPTVERLNFIDKRLWISFLTLLFRLMVMHNRVTKLVVLKIVVWVHKARLAALWSNLNILTITMTRTHRERYLHHNMTSLTHASTKPLLSVMTSTWTSWICKSQFPVSEVEPDPLWWLLLLSLPYSSMFEIII